MKHLYKDLLENKKNKYLFFFYCLLFLIAIYLRYSHFNARIGLGEDVSRDITIAQVALHYRQLPLIGSFSSAGPFVFGPIFIWFIMLSYLILPFTFYAPYILTGIVGLTTIGIIAYSGYLLGGKRWLLSQLY